MISEVLLYLLVITCMLTQFSSKEVKWTVCGTSPKLGQDLTLFCEVDNCFAHETKRWHGGPYKKPLMSNSGISTNKTKYNTSIENNGFILTILNLTVEDLNVSYECSCGFDLDKHILYIEDVYKADNLNKSTNGTNYVGIKDAGVKFGYIAIPVILVILLIIVIKRHWLWRKLKEKIYGPRRRNSDEDNIRNVGDSLLPTMCTEDSNASSVATFSTDEDNIRNVGDLLLPTMCTEHSNASSVATFSTDDKLHGNELLQQPQESINRVTAAESIEPSISREASSKIVEVKQNGVSTLPIQITSISITGIEKRESLETNSHLLPSIPDRSFPYSIRDDPASTCPGKRYKYADIKLRELSFKTWPLSKPTIVQLADAGFFQSGDTNMAICFSCGNKIYCNEGQDPLHEAFHNNCEYLRQIKITSTQLRTACSPDQ